MIVIDNVSKTFGGVPVVDGVSVTLGGPGVTSIIGPNGAGKSTLLSLIARLTDRDGGRVSVDGLDVDRTRSDILAQRLSILRQDNHIASRLTVRDLVGFGRYPYSHGRLTAEDRARVDQAIAYLHLTELSERFLDELSGGQRQRAHIAMVLAQDTDYVLLDEPLNNLDMKHARNMMQQIRRAADELGKTVVLVLHDINFASWYSDTIVAMKDGRICHAGPCAEIMRSEVLSSIYDMEIVVQEVQGKRISLFYA
ncbi:ABC transporter ATP-binding protein [Falsirhodobacter algicola]|uniref:ATP-binding cassette domain-containing protein n=1 Tax=Falsirhodobacter algicola TaxID=2692330 RepID=A0A8J8MRC2_9RHOB|nr:ABC transporter ATP-binding protein [Falsirhodobacter algicola]QUS35325.1 ATP-binding cassette domain-containing protein [Falsirhodobacter algicola]